MRIKVESVSIGMLDIEVKAEGCILHHQGQKFKISKPSLYRTYYDKHLIACDGGTFKINDKEAQFIAVTRHGIEHLCGEYAKVLDPVLIEALKHKESVTRDDVRKIKKYDDFWYCFEEGITGKEVVAIIERKIAEKKQQREEIGYKIIAKGKEANGECNVKDSYSIIECTNGKETLRFIERNIFDFGYVVNPDYCVAEGLEKGGIMDFDKETKKYYWMDFKNEKGWSRVREFTQFEEKCYNYITRNPSISRNIRL